MAGLILHGYHYSVYTRTVRMVLHMKSVPYATEEVDPFDPDQVADLRELHPFARVPILRDGNFTVYETQAILDYLERVYPDSALVPEDPEGAARMRQVMGIADSYVYWPLVRQAASQHVFLPMEGQPTDAAELQAGLDAAPRVLDALEAIAEEARVLGPGSVTLADCQLWPMMEYALMVPQIAEMVANRPALTAWVDAMRGHLAAVTTRPALEGLT